MKKLFRNHMGIAVTLFIYMMALLLFLLVHLGQFALNQIYYSNGTLQEKHLSISDFTLYDMEITGENTLYCYGSDPRMILNDASISVDTLTFSASYSLPPNMVTAFWAPAGQDYSVRAMAYPTNDENSIFYLPAGGGQSLRIDPGTQAGNVVTVNSIIINTKRPFYMFFIPTAGEAISLFTIPALLSCVIVTMRQSGRSFFVFRKNKKKAGDDK